MNKKIENSLNILEQLFDSVFNIIQNPDKKLLSEGYQVFDKVLNDPVVTGCVDTIIQSINSMDVNFTQNDASDDELKIIKTFITNFFENDFIYQNILAVLYGISYVNIVWKDDNNLLIPTENNLIPHNLFQFKYDKGTQKVQLNIFTDSSVYDGDPVPDYCVLYPQFNASTINPYGRGLLANCYKMHYIKSNTINFWSMFVEDSGQPKLDISITDALLQYLKENLQIDERGVLEEVLKEFSTLRQNGAFVHFEGLTAQNLASGSKDNSDIHSALIDYCDKQIAILLLGHNGAAQSTAGKLGSEDMAVMAVNSRLDSYAAFVADYCNVLIKWFHAINYGNGKAPQVKFTRKDDFLTLKNKADISAILFTQGVKFNDDYYQDHFYIDKKYFNVTEIKPSIPNQSAHLHEHNLLFESAVNDDNNNDILEKFSDYVLQDKDFLSANTEMIDTFLTKVNKYDNATDLLNDLYNIFPDLPIAKLQKIMTKAQLVARTFGDQNA